MGLGEQENLAIAYVQSIGTGGPDPAWLADDFTAWSPISGMMQRADYLPKLPAVKAIFTAPLAMKIDHTTSQIGRTAVQCRSHGQLFNGDTYTNDYHMLIEFDEDGRIRHVREYMDSKRAYEILIPALQQWMSANKAIPPAPAPVAE